MGRFNISDYARHNALADALSTAGLLLVLRQNLESRGVKNDRDLKTLEREGLRQIRPV